MSESLAALGLGMLFMTIKKLCMLHLIRSLLLSFKKDERLFRVSRYRASVAMVIKFRYIPTVVAVLLLVLVVKILNIIKFR